MTFREFFLPTKAEQLKALAEYRDERAARSRRKSTRWYRRTTHHLNKADYRGREAVRLHRESQDEQR